MTKIRSVFLFIVSAIALNAEIDYAFSVATKQDVAAGVLPFFCRVVHTTGNTVTLECILDPRQKYAEGFVGYELRVLTKPFSAEHQRSFREYLHHDLIDRIEDKKAKDSRFNVLISEIDTSYIIARFDANDRLSGLNVKVVCVPVRYLTE